MICCSTLYRLGNLEYLDLYPTGAGAMRIGRVPLRYRVARHGAGGSHGGVGALQPGALRSWLVHPCGRRLSASHSPGCAWSPGRIPGGALAEPAAVGQAQSRAGAGSVRGASSADMAERLGRLHQSHIDYCRQLSGQVLRGRTAGPGPGELAGARGRPQDQRHHRRPPGSPLSWDAGAF
ncbi:hypothetical protein D3C73_702400 [compost metagenome]